MVESLPLETARPRLKIAYAHVYHLTLSIEIAGEAAMIELGKRIAPRISRGAMIYLSGDLGAGKTTLARGILKGCGHAGSVTSPTYTLLETYTLPSLVVHHFDLYRMKTPFELEQIGLRDLLDGEAIALVEWPDRGRGVLPPADVRIDIGFTPSGRSIALPHCPAGRSRGGTGVIHVGRKLRVLVILAGFLVSTAHGAVIKEIRMWHAPDRSRIVFDMDHHSRFNVFTLEDPVRVVIDLDNAVLKGRIPAPEPPGSSSGGSARARTMAGPRGWCSTWRSRCAISFACSSPPAATSTGSWWISTIIPTIPKSGAGHSCGPAGGSRLPGHCRPRPRR